MNLLSVLVTILAGIALLAAHQLPPEQGVDAGFFTGVVLALALYAIHRRYG